MRIALHTVVRPDRIEEYEQAHREVPADLTAAIRDAGATSWTIWRSGTDLFHVLEVDDYPALIAALGEHSANTAWHTRMAELVESAGDYTSGSGDVPLPVVWNL